MSPVCFSASASCSSAPTSLGLYCSSARELLGRLRLLAEQRVGAPELPARVAIVGMQAQPLLQLRNARVVVAGVEVRDLEIALRDLHLRVELERAS